MLYYKPIETKTNMIYVKKGIQTCKQLNSHSLKDSC